MSIFDMYIPCEASSWTLLHQHRKLSSRISLQNQLFCLCRLPAVSYVLDSPAEVTFGGVHIQILFLYPQFNAIWGIFDVMMMSSLYWTWMFMELPHWSNSTWVDMCLRVAANTNCIVFVLTGTIPMIYHTCGKHINNCTTDLVIHIDYQ
jgi:hypothetical protein